MADTTSKPPSSIPIPPRPSARPEGAATSNAEGAAPKAWSTPPQTPRASERSAAGNAGENGSKGPKMEARGSAREPAGNGGNAERGDGESSRAGDASQRDPSQLSGSSMVTMAGAGVKKTRERVEDQIYTQRDRVSGGVRTLSRALRGAGGMLDEDELVARGLHYASDKAETVAGYIAELTPSRIASDLRNVSHSQPAWFFGGSFLLGLALGRFARSTAASETAPSRSFALPS